MGKKKEKVQGKRRESKVGLEESKDFSTVNGKKVQTASRECSVDSQEVEDGGKKENTGKQDEEVVSKFCGGY